MVYTSSTNIQIFPTAKRPTYDPVGRLTTEYNLTSILNKLLDVDGFVITSCNSGADLIVSTGDKDNSLDKDTPIPFDFNIHGYLIHIENIKDIIKNLSTADKIYAHICIESSEQRLKNGATQILNFISEGKDDEGKNRGESSTYCGVQFDSSSSVDNTGTLNYKHLQILAQTDTGWTIPEESKIKFTTSEGGYHRSVTIDDGVI